LIRKNATKGAIIVVNYLNADWDIGLLEAIRKGVRADLASEARRKAERETEDDRKIDLAAVPATDAIFVIGKFLGFALILPNYVKPASVDILESEKNGPNIVNLRPQTFISITERKLYHIPHTINHLPLQII
jgi:hypothetical protein